jgi:hypothetical protein
MQQSIDKSIALKKFIVPAKENTHLWDVTLIHSESELKLTVQVWTETDRLSEAIEVINEWRDQHNARIYQFLSASKV